VSAPEWNAANQLLLAAEFARLRAWLSDQGTSAAAEELAAARTAMPAPAAIDVLVDAFGLSGFERDVLLLCAGVEMDPALARLCGPAGANFSLALEKIPTAHWQALAPHRPLRSWRMIEVRDDRILTRSPLHIDERILHHLAGVDYLDARLRPFFTPRDATTTLADSQQQVLEPVAQALGRSIDGQLLVQLVGDDPAAQEEIARRAAGRRSLRLHSLRAVDIPAHAEEIDSMATLWTRESVLSRSALLVRVDDPEHPGAARLIGRAGGIVFAATRRAVNVDRPDTRFSVDRPLVHEQKRLWELALGESARPLNGSLDAICERTRLNIDVISRRGAAIRAEPSAALKQTLRDGIRESTRHRLADLAQRVEPMAGWQDLVLPPASLDTLRQIAAQVRQRQRVYDTWGFGRSGTRGLGVSVLFSGESGTGKTMAAEVLANELELDLYRIDLATLVSKYIGETEKNLRRVFDAAEEGGVILLFDEADALFGKRGEVNDSRDRYANIEVSYLLQRMECYCGLAILTTNLKNTLDAAFHRRLRFAVPFPFPDQSLRERIWQAAFPAGAPLADLDHRKLAQLNVAGGSIRNIALNAAFLAADADQPIGMTHLLEAARSEAAKRERPYSDAETRGWT
jgi:SpoVK/Ycf46/Vps4 family AAA+-type ATPase